MILNKYRHISFDLDGTLVHTLRDYRHAVIPKVVSKLGHSIQNPASVDKFWFEPGRDQTIKLEFGVEPSDFWPLFRQIDTPENRAHHTTAYPDAEPALRKLKSCGKIISVITGAPHWVAKLELEKLNQAPVDFFLSLVDGPYPEKPNPVSFHFVINELGQHPAETVYIGNSNDDAIYAKNAGVDFIYLERQEHEFKLRDESVAIIHSLSELFKHNEHN